jgi:hypothetical protein
LFKIEQSLFRHIPCQLSRMRVSKKPRRHLAARTSRKAARMMASVTAIVMRWCVGLGFVLLGMLAGLVTAITLLCMGAGLWAVLFAYAISGSAGAGLALIWFFARHQFALHHQNRPCLEHE